MSIVISARYGVCNSFFLVFSPVACQPASKLSYFGEQSEPRENARERGRGKESLQRSLINFHFHPGNPSLLHSRCQCRHALRDDQCVTTLKTAVQQTTETPGLRKASNCHRKRAADQRSADRLSRRNSIKTMFLMTEDILFFSTGTSNFNVSTRMKTQHFDSSFVYF